MRIKKFQEFTKINELYIHKKKKEDLNGKYFILFQKNLWIFSEEEWEKKKYYNALNKAYGKKIASSDLHDTFQTIKESYLDILVGSIEDDTVYINLDSRDFRQSEHSDDLYKLKKELDMPIKVRFYSGKYMDKEEETSLDIEKKKLSDRKFYHGTCLKFLPQILKNGLMPTSHTNYKDIEHENKIFFSLNIEKAQHHAFHAAMINSSFPVIIELKVPDINKLVVDYDLARDVYGDDSQIMSNLGYNEFDKGYNREGIGYKKDITNKIGIYGYLGRIPSTYIQDIWIDLYTYSNYQDIFNPDMGEFDSDSDVWNEFEDVRNWSEINKNEILKRIENIHDDYLSEFEDENEDNE